MQTVKPRRPSGFQEYTPAEQIEFNKLVDIIRRTYEKYGFAPLDTPAIELSEVLLAGSGGETSKQVYRFKREGSDTDLTLRYDLTVPLARYVSEHQSDLAFPFRRYQIGKVHRAERAQAGRFREFYQADIDVIGSASPSVDAEFPAIINEIFEAFNFGDFVIRINSRMVLGGYFEALGIADKSVEVLRVVDKIEKISREEFISQLEGLGLEQSQVQGVVDFTSITGSNDEVIGYLSKMKETLTGSFSEGVDKLVAVVESIRALGVPENRFAIDLRIARGLDYYTGTVYETFLNDHPELGSVCSGGRYDNLTRSYTDRELPGVGISIGLSRLFYKLREAGVIEPSAQTPAKALVVSIRPEDASYATAVAAQLRGAGLPTLTLVDDIQLGKKFKYADKLGFSHMIVVGETERQSQTVTLKDMKTGESQQMTVEEVLGLLRKSVCCDCSCCGSAGICADRSCCDNCQN